MSRRALLIVVSAPSGAGKTTLCDRMLAAHDWIRYSVSCTTRAPRGNEIDGVDYEFVNPETFAHYVAHGDFLEYATVHGFMYGTRRSPVLAALRSGQSILMDIDVQGAALIREAAGGEEGLLSRSFVDIFIEPPSIDALRERLQARGEDAPQVIEKRMRNALDEMQQAHRYKHRIVNVDLDEAFAQFEQILVRESHGAACTAPDSPPPS